MEDELDLELLLEAAAQRVASQFKDRLHRLQLENRDLRSLLLEHVPERGRRELMHIHDGPYAIEKPVLTFDVHGTITPSRGFPLDKPPFPGLVDWLHKMVGRGCCVHVVSSSLDISQQEIARAREEQIREYANRYSIPCEFVGPKSAADWYVDDRGVEIPFQADYAELGAQAEERLLEAWKLNDFGLYQKRDDLQPVGDEITEWPDVESLPGDYPRGWSTPVLDIDFHRTVNPGWGGKREADPDPLGVQWVRHLYQQGVQVFFSCASWSDATHSQQVKGMVLGAMRAYALRHGIPYDLFVAKDDFDLMFDNQMIRFTTWEETGPRIEERVGKKLSRYFKFQVPDADTVASK